VILIDTGPIIGLFDPLDPFHKRSVKLLQQIHEPLFSTLPVLTEAFHMLNPGSLSAENLRSFIVNEGLIIWYMDLADASLVVAAETLRTRRIFTMDRDDFETYHIKIGHRYHPFEIFK
jgi:uncharacterized protein